MQGFIKLHRQILDNPIVCKDTEYYAVWSYLLLNAMHTNIDKWFDGKKITLMPGQLITGRKAIAEKFNISESKVQRILKTFEIEQQIEQQTSTKNRLITVLGWCKYQSSEQQNEQQLNNKRTTTEQQLNTNKNVKNDKNVKKGSIGDISQTVMTIILNDKTEYNVKKSLVDELSPLYPAVDIMQELRKMKAWSISNPTLRKTRSGVRRFINSWLSREQDKNKGVKTTEYDNAF